MRKLNKKGASAIEMVIGFMILIIMISFLMDIISVLLKFSTVSQVSTEVARLAGVQGGISDKVPRGWPGGSDNYVKLDSMNEFINSKFESSGISSDDWSISIKDDNGSIGRLGASTGRIETDYLNSFTVETRVKYRWSMVSNFIPGNIEQTIVSRRPGVSEWKYNYDTWTGEWDE